MGLIVVTLPTIKVIREGARTVRPFQRGFAELHFRLRALMALLVFANRGVYRGAWAVIKLVRQWAEGPDDLWMSPPALAVGAAVWADFPKSGSKRHQVYRGDSFMV
jgi:hypothetical protein